MKHAIRLLEKKVKELNYILSGNYATEDSDYHKRCRAETTLELKECVDELEILNGAVVKRAKVCIGCNFYDGCKGSRADGEICNYGTYFTNLSET